jgi:flagellar hook-length control protein FliK
VASVAAQLTPVAAAVQVGTSSASVDTIQPATSTGPVATTNTPIPLTSHEQLFASAVSVSISTGIAAASVVKTPIKQGDVADSVPGRAALAKDVSTKDVTGLTVQVGQPIDKPVDASATTQQPDQRASSDSGGAATSEAPKPAVERKLAETDSPDASSPQTPSIQSTSGVHIRGQHPTEVHPSVSASTVTSTGLAAHADAADVARQLGRHIAGARLAGLSHDRPMHLSVLLHPEDLGEVSVQLTLASGRIDVQVSSQSDTTRDMLRQGMQDLRRQLSESGVSVGDLDVHDGWSQQSNSSQNSANTADQRGSQQPRLAGATATSSSRMTTPEPTVVHRPSRTGIDILA